jgi:hypothetical protein
MLALALTAVSRTGGIDSAVRGELLKRQLISPSFHRLESFGSAPWTGESDALSTSTIYLSAGIALCTGAAVPGRDLEF